MTEMTDAAATVANATSCGAMEGLLTPETAAALLGVAPATLEAWRRRGTGPTFIKLGARMVRYRRAHLDAFIAGRVVSNTVQAHAIGRASSQTCGSFDKERKLFSRRS